MFLMVPSFPEVLGGKVFKAPEHVSRIVEFSADAGGKTKQ
jgi:hypothetical protein